MARLETILLPVATATLLASCQTNPTPTQLVGRGDGQYFRAQCPAGQYVKGIAGRILPPAAGEVSPDFRLSSVSFTCSALSATAQPTYHVLFDFSNQGHSSSNGGCSNALAALGSSIVRMTYDGTGGGMEFVGSLHATCYRPDLGMSTDNTFMVGIGGGRTEAVSCQPTKLAVGLQARINLAQKAAVGFGLLCG
jgi:hypothetical protein